MYTKSHVSFGKTPENVLRNQRAYNERHPGRRTEIQQRYAAKQDPVKRRENFRRLNDRVRLQAIMFLGGTCNKCGNNDSRVLQIDHVNGGGTQENKKVHARGIAQRAMREPHDFQLLCANCNWIKRWERNENKQRIDNAA